MGAPANDRPRPWIVLKFGGTSVSTRDGWDVVRRRVGELLPDHRVWIVASALSGVSNLLERALRAARDGDLGDVVERIAARHRELAEALELPAADRAEVDDLTGDLERLLEGARLTGEASPRLEARVLSFGELASTALGVAYLRHAGVSVVRVDARDLLRSRTEPGESHERRYLAADVRVDADAGRIDAAADGADVALTQGFVARTPAGHTTLLGRGGSDTSATLFAVMAGASHVEIWTDVHGMFTADPRAIPTARLVRRVGYREARELATLGAKVLHPRCLDPLEAHAIPATIRNTFDPEAEGTHIGADPSEEPSVTAVVCRRGVTLVTLSTLSMWGASGFLARAFAPFETFGISVDLVATSQSAISVTLDPVPGGVDPERFEALLTALGAMGEVAVVEDCAVVSIVGRRIRTVLHELGPALTAFREHRVHLVSDSSEDLNLSFVVDDHAAGPLLGDLHAHLFPPRNHDAPTEGDPAGDRFGPTWELLSQKDADRDGGQRAPRPDAWWRARRGELVAMAADGAPRFVYDVATVRARASELRTSIASVGSWFYAMKANSHPDVLRAIASAGFGFECVSAAEVERVREVAGGAPVLFTPNFCPVAEYARARELGAELTIDGAHVFEHAGEALRGARLGVRVDPGVGLGHHEKVRTAGAHTKFGQPIDDLGAVAEAAAAHDATIVGLHAHVGSGVQDPGAWARTGEQLAQVASSFPELRWIDVGGGLGVPERPGATKLDLAAVDRGLRAVATGLGNVELRMEPGRYLVAEAGVLVAPVTQVRVKGGVQYVGIATGMNSLLRPALYGAWHGIHNLTRLDAPPTRYAHVVGPICETGDVLGRDRLLPETAAGDVVLIEHCGAYGAAMASRYNLRDPAEECVLLD